MLDSKLRSIWMGLFAVALWAAIPAFVKIGSTFETLPFLLVLRFAIASVFFIPLIPKMRARLSKIPLKLYVAMTVCLGANFYFQGLAMIHLPVSWYLIIFCLNPLFALVFMGIAFNRRLLLGVVLSIAGTMLFVNPQEIQSTYGWLPIFYVFIGMMTWVAYTVLIKRFQAVFTNAEVTGLTQFSALFACAAIWMFNGLHTFQLTSENTTSVLALGVLTPLAYFSFASCLKTMPRFGVVSQYLEPVFGILIGVLFFQETLSTVQIIGSAMIVFGSVTIES